MDNAVNAVSKLFAKDPAPEEKVPNGTSNSSAPTSSNSDVDTKTVESEVAPAVEHTHVKKQHETREQTVVSKEKHQDHYHTTIQPLKDSEVLPEKHDYTQETEHRSINHDNDGEAKAEAEADRAGLGESTSEQKESEVVTKEEAKEGEEHVHHHLHETVQPVIEKG
jgi:hypothetical protein